MGVERSRDVSGRTGLAVREVELESDLEVFGDQRMIKTGEAVNVFHHASRSVKHLEEISQEFLSPTADLVDGTIIFEDLLNGAAIA